MQDVMEKPAATPANGFTEFFKSNNIFPGLNDDQLKIIAENCSVERYQKGDLILQSEQEYSALLILFHGTVDVVLESSGNTQKFVIATLEAGTHFGEKGFMEMGGAAANVIASEPVTVLSIQRDIANKLDIYQSMIKSIATVQTHRMQHANSRHAEALKAAFDRQIEQNSFGRFYIATILLFAISSFFPDYTHESPSFQLAIRWVYLLLVLFPAIYAIKQQNVPMSVFGITTKGWQKSLFESILVSIAFLPVLILFKIYNAPPDQPVFSWDTLKAFSSVQLAIHIITYVPHSAIQEFIARGVGQGSLQRFMPEAHFMKPIVITSLLFGILHLHLSIKAAVFTFLVSLLFGYLYYRHKTLVGVFALHVVLGVSATALGLI
nr:CPBP family glutamic-type intramembrane protease [Sneathiella aquimaris]